MSQNTKEVYFKVIIEPYDPKYSFYVKYDGSEAQDLYKFVERELDVHGKYVLVQIETKTTNIHRGKTKTQSKIKPREITVSRWSKRDQISRNFLLLLADYGFNIEK